MRYKMTIIISPSYYRSRKMLTTMTTTALLLALLLVVVAPPVAATLEEDVRVAEYHKRNYTWPIPSYNPDTPGWRALMEQRFQQVAQLENTNARYNGYLFTVNPAALVPNFTEHGFGLARAPDDLLAALQQGIHDGLPTARLEESVEVIQGPHKPLFIDRPDLMRRVLQELRNYAETWANVPLTPHLAYGFRLYRNEAQLHMHVDRMQTHIVSFILHIDSSEDAEPWPIYIEDFHGRTHEVILTPGDMLFYESSKCFHGRPKPFKGSWYSSVFVHYYPTHGWSEQDHDLEAHYAVPPHWRNSANLATPASSSGSSAPSSPEEDENEMQHQQQRILPKLEMFGTSFAEPECPNAWCRTQDSVKWSGPGEDGYWIAPTMERFPFEPQKVEWNEEL